MGVQTNSSFKVKASPVNTTTGLVPEAGAIVHDLSTDTLKIGDGSAWHEVMAAPYNNTYWVDLLGPATASRLDSVSSRYQFNFFNGTVSFNADARYTNEPLMFKYQLLHEWKIGTDGKPHLHWKQQSANIPNWLVGYFLEVNGDSSAIETDYTNYEFGVIQDHAFTYTSGVLNQISVLPDFDLSGAKLSSVLRIILFRDTTNASGLFAGVDPSALVEHISDLDVHIQVDAPGSDDQFIK